jgi:hypothetical protein
LVSLFAFLLNGKKNKNAKKIRKIRIYEILISKIISTDSVSPARIAVDQRHSRKSRMKKPKVIGANAYDIPVLMCPASDMITKMYVFRE